MGFKIFIKLRKVLSGVFISGVQILLTVGGELCVLNTLAKRLGVFLKQLINCVRSKKIAPAAAGVNF